MLAHRAHRVTRRRRPARPSSTPIARRRWRRRARRSILVRIETNPDDVHGMIAAEGMLTSRGGATSHAAVVARGMGKPCVAGARVDPGRPARSASSPPAARRSRKASRSRSTARPATCIAGPGRRRSTPRSRGELERAACAGPTSSAASRCGRTPTTRTTRSARARSARRASACAAPSTCSCSRSACRSCRR